MKRYFNLTSAAIFIALHILLIEGCSTHPDNPLVTSHRFTLTDSMMSRIELFPVNKEPLRSEIQLYGTITADRNKYIDIYPIVGGNVVKVYVELGDFVQKGQLLATIRSNEVAGYEKELNDAENDVVVAKKNLKVVEELYQGKLNTDRDVLVAKSMLQKAESQLQKIKETFQIYALKSGAIYDVRSPISGFIVAKNINQDMMLRNDRSDNIFDVAQLDEVWAIANVNESYIGQVRVGMNASVITNSYPDTVFTGKVDKLFNIIDPETKAMKVRIILKNPAYNSKSYVMIYHNRDSVETREVNIFRQVGSSTYIRSGTSVGDTIITKNQLLIYDALND
jgi:cobalt-zinc-cadmium efflux system membrane fusion protein